MSEPYLWRTANMSRKGCVVAKQMQYDPILCHRALYECTNRSLSLVFCSSLSVAIGWRFRRSTLQMLFPIGDVDDTKDVHRAHDSFFYRFCLNSVSCHIICVPIYNMLWHRLLMQLIDNHLQLHSVIFHEDIFILSIWYVCGNLSYLSEVTLCDR